MEKFKAWICSSIGKKQIVGLTGLGIGLFTISHMASNLLIPFSARAYNFYSYNLISNPLLPLIELILLTAFLVHIFFASQLWLSNRAARPQANASHGSGAKRATFASRSMILSGLLLLTFLVLHLITFKYGAHYTIVYDGIEMRDLHTLVIEKFQDPLYTAWYLFSLAVLGLHLSHGVSSLFQSLGIFSAREPWLRQMSWAVAIVVAGGFSVTPFWVLCCGGK